MLHLRLQPSISLVVANLVVADSFLIIEGGTRKISTAQHTVEVSRCCIYQGQPCPPIPPCLMIEPFLLGMRELMLMTIIRTFHPK
jgi:hypothetical protein